ncbi:hypothetical protein [Allocoleopsis sp.]|uniref:hypothetical protein n=1 Tax=Allocoleopsis sp. TaxID=3088169 RepID=UPI002FD4928A
MLEVLEVLAFLVTPNHLLNSILQQPHAEVDFFLIILCVGLSAIARELQLSSLALRCSPFIAAGNGALKHWSSLNKHLAI